MFVKLEKVPFLQRQQNFILSSNLPILIITLLPRPCAKQMLFVKRHKRVTACKKLINGKWNSNSYLMICTELIQGAGLCFTT